MTGLAYWDNGFKQMTANKKLLAPADFKGLKFRIQSSKVLEAQFRALGSIPQVMAFGEVYQALQTGVVDGQENTWSNIYTQKMHEVQKYATVTNHGYIGYVVVVNKKFWDGLPPDLRAGCEKAMKEATEFGNGQSAKENEDALAEIKKAGKTEIVTLTPEQDDAMRKAMMPVYKDVASRVGQPLIDEFLKETGRSPSIELAIQEKLRARAPGKVHDRAAGLAARSSRGTCMLYGFSTGLRKPSSRA